MKKILVLLLMISFGVNLIACVKKQEAKYEFELEEIKLKNNNVEVLLDKYDNHIYYAPYVYRLEEINENAFIYDLDIKENKEKLVSESIYTQMPIFQSLQINKDYAMYLDSINSLGKLTIFVENRKSKNIKKLYELENKYQNMETPFLYKNYVAYITYMEDEDKEIPVVKLHDLNENTQIIVQKLNDCGVYNLNIYFYNDKLYWTDNINNKAFVKYYDLKTKEITTLDLEISKYPSIEFMDDDYIFILNQNNIEDYTNAEYILYDLKEMKENRIIEKGNYNLFSRIDKGFFSDENIYDSKDEDNRKKIWFYNIVDGKLNSTKLDLKFKGKLESIDTLFEKNSVFIQSEENDKYYYYIVKQK